MKLRLLTTLAVAAILSGCATYDYAGGSAPGGYYHGRPSVEYYGPYGGGYGYYGYPSSGYIGGYTGYGYSRPYYGYGSGYYPYRPYHRPHRPPARPDHGGHNPPPPTSQVKRAPPWRTLDGRYLESGSVMIPPRHRGVPQAIGPPALRDPGRPQAVPAPRPMGPPSAPRAERPPPMERTERVRVPQESRERGNGRVRTQEP